MHWKVSPAIYLTLCMMLHAIPNHTLSSGLEPPLNWTWNLKTGLHSCCHAPQFHYIAQFHFGSVWFWLFTVLLIVWPQSLLLSPFHKKLRIWWKKSFGFCQTDNPRFSCIMYSYCYRYRQVTHKNMEVSEFSTLRKSTKRESLVIRTWDFP